MRVRSEVSPEKLRGGFYSPPALVGRCLDLIQGLIADRSGLDLLEPTVGSGAFIEGLAEHPLGARIERIEGVELLPPEAALARDALRATKFAGSITCASFLPWSMDNIGEFDIAVGNPPFVRFQFVTAEDRRAADLLGYRLGISFQGVSNLWIPILTAALSCLRIGGVFAFIVPTELLTGTSAATIRAWLLHSTVDLRVDLHAPGSFPNVLQEVIILSGVRSSSSTRSVTFADNRDGSTRCWSHAVDSSALTWTRYLLPPHELGALSAGASLPSFHRMASVARFEVAAVTGANAYFSVTSDVVQKYGLGPWATPLLTRTRHAPGLTYSHSDHAEAAKAGQKTWLLHFAANRADPGTHSLAQEYLQQGVNAGLHLRYKTRIREPWYRVPHVRAGRMMLSKRSHRYPRLILNDADVVTTDTIYRGLMKPEFEGGERGLVAGFHNSLTMLSAEVEGRSFGGGVLELVPGEVARLIVPMAPSMALRLEELSAIAQEAGDPEALLDRTDDLLVSQLGVGRDLLDNLRNGRVRLQARRLERNHANDLNGHVNGRSTHDRG